jgi:hypothetical protein
MAPNGLSGVHLDAYQSDTYTFGGPLGHSLEVTSTFRAALCGTVTFDSKGRIIVVCVGERPVVYLMDPVTLRTMSRLVMPNPQTSGPATFGAGGYFFLDQMDRAVIPTRSNDIWRVKVVDRPFLGPKLETDHTCEDDLRQRSPRTSRFCRRFPTRTVCSGLLRAEEINLSWNRRWWGR